MTIYLIGYLVALILILIVFIFNLEESEIDKKDIIVNLLIIFFVSFFSWITVATVIAIIMFTT